jgi:hypothetical protein
MTADHCERRMASTVQALRRPGGSTVDPMGRLTMTSPHTTTCVVSNRLPLARPSQRQQFFCFVFPADRSAQKAKLPPRPAVPSSRYGSRLGRRPHLLQWQSRRPKHDSDKRESSDTSRLHS